MMQVRAHINELADQCVKCGLCLPVCPTYRIARTEAESPRGRIALAQAIANEQLATSAALLAHLDQCLSCMSCERVCPSQVQYGQLIVATRATLHKSARGAQSGSAIGFMLAHPRWLRACLRAVNLPGIRTIAQSRFMQTLLRPMRLDRAARELPHLPAPVRIRKGAVKSPARGRVGLFLGCIAASVDRDVHAGAVVLLQALGYEVVLAHGQGCCGALHLHTGDATRATQLQQATQRRFVEAGVDTVLVSASGCFGTLRDHVFAGTPIRACDIHEFLDTDARIDSLRFRPLKQRIALHTPCTQANVVRSGDTIARLLSKIPQLEVTALPVEPRCCGAAGDYFLRHPHVADVLRDEKLDQCAQLTPDWLVTSNVGCRIFLGNGLRQRDENMVVAHPIALLAQQLDN